MGLTVPLSVAVVAVILVAETVVTVGALPLVGVTLLEGLDAGPVPIALVAFTVKV